MATHYIIQSTTESSKPLKLLHVALGLAKFNGHEIIAVFKIYKK